MTEGTRVIFASIAGLLPWGIAAIVTNWYNDCLLYTSRCV